jgi:hypothetical protein
MLVIVFTRKAGACPLSGALKGAIIYTQMLDFEGTNTLAYFVAAMDKV